MTVLNKEKIEILALVYKQGIFSFAGDEAELLDLQYPGLVLLHPEASVAWLTLRGKEVLESLVDLSSLN